MTFMWNFSWNGCGCGCCCRLSPSFSLINNIINYENFHSWDCVQDTHRFTVRTHTHTMIPCVRRRHSHRLFRHIYSIYNIYVDFKVTHVLLDSIRWTQNGSSIKWQTQYTRLTRLKTLWNTDNMKSVYITSCASSCQQHSNPLKVKLNEQTHLKNVKRSTCIGKIGRHEKTNQQQQQLPLYSIYERHQFNNNNSFAEAPNKMNIPASDNKWFLMFLFLFALVLFLFFIPFGFCFNPIF